MADKKTRFRLVILNIALALALIIFACSFRYDAAVPALAEGEAESRPSTYALLQAIWRVPGLEVRVFRLGYPMIALLESAQGEHQLTLSQRVLGSLLGFEVRSAKDIVLACLPRDTYEPVEYESVSDLEQEWVKTNVLFSLGPGDYALTAANLSGSAPMVAIYHTHATESYLPEIGQNRAEQAFTSDLSRSVVKVGDILAEELETRYLIPCVHSRSVHDDEGRLGAYYRSEATVKAILQKYPGCKILVDLHRDSQPRSLTTVTVRGKTYARLMFVVGTDHPGWVQNYEFARRVSKLIEEEYPGVSRGIFYAQAVYNQKYSPGAILVEVGGVDNTMEECANSARVLAWALASVMLPASPQHP